MAQGGITYGVAKTILATVVEGGVDPNDDRVLNRTNEATKAILDELIPVGGMITADIVASGTTLLLPPEFENAIEVQALSTSVYGSTDVAQGWYDIVNQSTYVDPEQAHDNPLVDQGLEPDPVDPTILRRQYDYVGLMPNSTVRVTGAKRYIPLSDDEDYLIVQNLRALKLMIMAIEGEENNDFQNAEANRQKCLALLQAEVKKHLLDPRNHMRRKSEYQLDLVTFAENTFGWMRANIALEVPGMLAKGKQDISFTLEQAERRIMQRGVWKDTIIEYTATVTGGTIALPLNVQSVLAIDLNGHPIPVRSQFLQYLENGPGMFATHNMLIDQGEKDFVDGRRRIYKLVALTTLDQPVTLLCKLRCLTKQPADQMVIKNFEALRLMSTAIMQEEKEDWQTAVGNQQMAIDVMQKELDDYLAGVIHTVRVQDHGFGLGNVGCNL